MKKLLLLIFLLTVSITIKAQTCHYCTEQELIEMLNGDEEEYKTGYTDSGTKYFYIQRGYCTQIYYIYHNINTIYAIITDNEEYSRDVVKKLNKTYEQQSLTSWKAELFSIDLKYEDDVYAFVFTYK